MVAEPVIWLNGQFIPRHIAGIPPDDRGVLLGDGLFETMLIKSGIVQHASLHLARLQDGATRLGISIPYAAEAILKACHAVAQLNNLGSAALRLTLTRGTGPRGLGPIPAPAPNLWISAFPIVPILPTVTAIICTITRRNEFSPLSTMKTLNYLDNIIARGEAEAEGADDAILLNTQGFVAAATTANIFVRHAGAWLTPRRQDGALPGIFRARLLAAGILREARLSVDDLHASDGVCLGNTLGVRIVTSLNTQRLRQNAAAVAALRFCHEAVDE